MTRTEYDFSKLIGKLAEKGETRISIANKIGITPQSFANKLNNNSPFTVSESKQICDILNIDYRNMHVYFFNLKSQK